jgi:hypothetical protein
MIQDDENKCDDPEFTIKKYLGLFNDFAKIISKISELIMNCDAGNIKVLPSQTRISNCL